ncbi:MAG: hypothetical protein AAF720_01510 [Pseudomonadota bacterium]
MSESPNTENFKQAAQKAGKSKKKYPPPFSIRFTDQEKAYLESAAGTLSLASYIRLKLFDVPDLPFPHRKPSKKRRTPSAELSVIGQMLGGLGQSRLAANLNQIAKAANMGALPVTPELEQELLEACAAIKGMRSELVAALGIKNQD